MDHGNTLLVSFFSAVAFTLGLPFILQKLRYELGLASKVYFGKKSRVQVLLKPALILVGGGLLLSWLMLQLVGYWDGQLQFRAGESYRDADTYAWIARHWAFAFAAAGIIAFKLVADSVGFYVDRETKKDNLKAAYGVKEWATGDEIRKRLSRGNASDSLIGIHIGEGVHWNEKGHMLCVGGSGQGKGVNLVLPALLSEGLLDAGVSIVCLDPKGENAAVAAPHLKRAGYDVHILNPFGIREITDLGNSRFDPLDLIDPDSNDASKLYDMLAMALHNRRGTGDNSFFDNRCRQYISLYLSFAHWVGEGWERFYKMFMVGPDKRAELLALMMSQKEKGFEGADMAAAILGRLTSDAAKTEENIYGTIEEAINILKDKNLRDSLSESDFDLTIIAERPTAIFVCIPFEELGYYAAWVRMFFGSVLRTLTKHYNPEHKVLVLLDEFPQLSYMDEVVRSLAVLRGYNVTLWPIVQSLTQLKTIYGDNWELFLSSAIVKHWLSNGADNFTADYITKRLPQALKFIGNNADGSPKEVQTKLLEHQDVITFNDMICELSGLDKPVKFKKVPYWDNPFSKDNASRNPFY